MEFKSLFLGILFSVAIFSIKAGVGLHYRFNQANCLNLKKRSNVTWWVSFWFVALYGILFATVGALVACMEIQTDLKNIQLFFESGMLIHLILASLMLIWGFILLKSNRAVGQSSSAWLALILPCPLCMAVIGISVAFILALFPDNSIEPLLLFYLIFMALSFLTAACMDKLQRWFIRSPEFMLGYAMATIAAYFLLSILIMPQFSGLDDIYSIASNLRSDGEGANLLVLPIALGISITFFAAGYLKMHKKITRNMSHM